MQLISATLLLITALLLLCAIHFLLLWRKLWRREELTSHSNDNIGLYGITLISAYPSTLRPLLAMVEERYPRSEVVLLCDMQRHIDRFGEVVQRFSLVRVNHDHLDGVRALYRSRQRAFRRIVVVDLPLEERLRSEAILPHPLHRGRHNHRARHGSSLHCCHRLPPYRRTHLALELRRRGRGGANGRCTYNRAPHHRSPHSVAGEATSQGSPTRLPCSLVHHRCWGLLVALYLSPICRHGYYSDIHIVSHNEPKRPFYSLRHNIAQFLSLYS